MLRKFLNKLFGKTTTVDKQEIQERSAETTNAVIDFVYNELTPIGTIAVSDYHVVSGQKTKINLGFFKLLDENKKTLSVWDSEKGLRPIRAMLFFDYIVESDYFKITGSATAENAKDSEIVIDIPKFKYPCHEEVFTGAGGTKIIHNYGSYSTPYIDVTVTVTVTRVIFTEKPLKLTPSAIVEAEPIISLPQTFTYTATMAPTPTIAIEFKPAEEARPKLDTRPPEIIREQPRSIYPTLDSLAIGNIFSLEKKWQKVKDLKEEPTQPKGVTSNKMLTIVYEKDQTTKIFIQYNISGMDDWVPVLYGEELDSNRVTVPLPEDARYVNVQAYVYPREFLNIVGVDGIEYIVDQSYLAGEGYAPERRYGEYFKGGNSSGIRIYLDAEGVSKLPRLWTVRITPKTFKPYHRIIEKMEGNQVKVGVIWAGGSEEVPAADVVVEAIHVDMYGVTKSRTKKKTLDLFTKVIAAMTFPVPTEEAPESLKPEEGDLFIIRYQGLYDAKDFQRGYYPPPEGADITYRYYPDRGWVKHG